MIDIAHIHPMLIHFPLALTPLAVAIQLLALYRQGNIFERGCLQATGVSLIALAAVAAIVAAIFGDIALEHAVDAGVSRDVLEGHEELGKSSAAALTIIALAELWLYRRHVTAVAVKGGAALVGVLMVLLLITTAYFGGDLVYGHGVAVAHLPEKHSHAVADAPTTADGHTRANDAPQ